MGYGNGNMGMGVWERVAHLFPPASRFLSMLRELLEFLQLPPALGVGVPWGSAGSEELMNFETKGVLI